LIISKYFAVLIGVMCVMVIFISNMMFFVIVGRIVLVVFVVCILQGSLGNFIIPLMLMNLIYNGGFIFLVMILILLFI